MLSGRFWGGSALFITSCWCLKKRREAWSSIGVVLQFTRGKSSTGQSSGSKDKQKDGRKCLWGGGNWQTWDSGCFGVNRLKWGEVFEGWEEQKERAAEGIPKRRFQKGGWGRPSGHHEHPILLKVSGTRGHHHHTETLCLSSSVTRPCVVPGLCGRQWDAVRPRGAHRAAASNHLPKSTGELLAPVTATNNQQWELSVWKPAPRQASSFHPAMFRGICTGSGTYNQELSGRGWLMLKTRGIWLWKTDFSSSPSSLSSVVLHDLLTEMSSFLFKWQELCSVTVIQEGDK